MLSVKNYVKLFSLTIFFISVSCNKEVTEPESVPPGLLSFAWEQTGGPSFGPVSAVVSRPGDLLAASKNNLLRTTDGGKTWKKILSILGEITGLVAENNMILVSTSWDDPGKKIYRSIDNGNTWNTVGPTVKTIRTIKLLNGNIYFIVAGGGLFSSNSDFSSYTRILEEQALIKDVTITPQGDLLVSGGSLLKSTDNGSTWTAIEGYTHAMAVSKDGYIFASYSNQISYSKDGGNTWEIFIDNVGSREVRYLYSQGDYLYMALEDLGFYRSPTNTPSLTKISQFDMAKFNEDSQSYAIAGTNEGDLYLGCYPYGLFVSKDNGNSLKQIGLPTSAVSMMVSDKYNNLYAVSGYYTWKFSPVTYDWTSIERPVLPPQMGIYSITTNSEDIFLNTANGIYILKEDNQWSLYAFEGQRVITTGKGASNDFYVLTEQGLYVKKNGTADWTQLLSDISLTSFDCLNNTVVTGGYQGKIFSSNDNGNTWESSKINADGFVEKIVVAPNGSVFATIRNWYYGTNELYCSKNNGKNWNKVNVPVTQVGLRGFAVDVNDCLYITSHDGLFGSNDNGETWTKINELNDHSLNNIIINNNGYSYLGTSESGLLVSKNK